MTTGPYKATQIEDAGDALAQCDGCAWEGPASATNEVEDCALTPGDPSPVGRCPHCDSLAYLKKPLREALFDNIELKLNEFDEQGNVAGFDTRTLSRSQIADIIDHATQLIAVGRAGGNTKSVMEELAEALGLNGDAEPLKAGDKVYFGRGPVEFIGIVRSIADDGKLTVEGVEVGTCCERLLTVVISNTKDLHAVDQEEWDTRTLYEPAFAHLMSKEAFLHCLKCRQGFIDRLASGTKLSTEEMLSQEFMLHELELVIQNASWVEDEDLGCKPKADLSATPCGLPNLALPMKGDRKLVVTESLVKHYQKLYPELDVVKSLPNILGWLEANPSRRAVDELGLRRQISSWLKKERRDAETSIGRKS